MLPTASMDTSFGSGALANHAPQPITERDYAHDLQAIHRESGRRVETNLQGLLDLCSALGAYALLI